MANVFLCHLEDKLTRDGVMPALYKRYVDDTLVRMPSSDAATDFLTTLNSLHPRLSFTMELPIDNKISFIGIEIVKNRTKIDTQAYRKHPNTGLLLHFHSHTDKRYKEFLRKTMVHRAHALSSTTEAFNQECTRLSSIFTRLDYPLVMINSTITETIQSFSFGTREKNEVDNSVVRVSLPFKDQTSVNAVKRQMRDLSHKIGITLQPIFGSRKLEQDLKPREIKLPIVNQQCVVYSFTCDLCDSDYVGYTVRHLHQRIVEHKNSAFGKHFLTAHGDTSLLKGSQSHILKKSVKENLTVSSIRCSSLSSAILDLTRTLIPFAQSSLFKNILIILFFFLLFKNFCFTFRIDNNVSQTSKRRL